MTDQPDRAIRATPVDRPDPGQPHTTMTLRGLPDGTIQASVSGGATRGEENCATVANLVVILLNEWGESWGSPRIPHGTESGVDMIADGPRGQLRLQITRVPRSTAHWRNLGVDGHTSISATTDEFADELIEAIRQKAGRYPAPIRSTTMLVLDGQHSIGFDLPAVLSAFTRQHLAEAQASGFDNIFLLGTVRFVNLLRPQLDPVWFSVP